MPLNTPEYHEENETLEVIGTLGIADELITNPEKLMETGMWMGIGLSKKTYPDQMVLDYAKWISEHTANGLIVIADDIQLYNKVPTSSKSWDKLKDVKRVRKKGRERKSKINGMLNQNGIFNIDVKQWSEIFADLENESENSGLFINYELQIFDYLRSQSPDLNQALLSIPERQAPEMFRRLQDDPKTKTAMPHVKLATSMYAQEEIFLTIILAALNKFPLKIGHEGEKIYDQLTLEIVSGKWKGLSQDINGDKIKFGAIHLR